jgi:P4 family phage/plasmid primase-like protien
MAYGGYASFYVLAGWRCVLPVPVRSKTPPPTGYTGDHGIDEVAPEVLAEWERAHADDSIALRLPAGVICIDIDHYDKPKVLPDGSVTIVAKRGNDTIAEYEAKWGPLPPTWASTARGNPDTGAGASRTLFYRVPPGRYATTLGDPRTSAVEILQRHHRYCVVWPSINPDANNAQYLWYGPGDLGEQRPPWIDELAALPSAWVIGLAEGASAASAAAAPAHEGAALLATLLDDTREPCADITNIALTAADELDHAAAGSRHDIATGRIFQLIRAGAFGHPGAGGVLADLRSRWDGLTAGEHRADEFARMASSAACKAVTEVSATGSAVPVGYDPCEMGTVVAPPVPGRPSHTTGSDGELDDARDADVLDIPAPAAPVVWSRRALIGTQAFDPRGHLDQVLASQALERIGPVLRFATDVSAWCVRGPYSWDMAPGDMADWALTELFELMPHGDPDSESSDAQDRASRRKRFGQNSGSAGIASKLRALVRASGGAHTVRLSDLDADPEIMWAGRLAWSLRDCIERPALANLPDDTPHLHSAGVAPSGLGIEHPTPAWDAFLAAVWPDPAIREWALAVTSVALTGYSDAVMPLLWGETGRGKTAYTALVMSVLGSYAIAADPRLLTSAADNAHASIIYALRGVRLAFIDEGPRDAKWAVSKLKQLTGGARLTGNPMRGNPVNFDPSHTLMLTCNPEETPGFQDKALRRRLRLIPCEGEPDEVGRTRAAITPAVWRAEAPGVLAKLMHHTACWLADPSTAAQWSAPEAIRWRAEDIANEEDQIRQWIDAEMEPCENGTRVSDLLIWFIDWLRKVAPRANPPTATLFGRKLTELGYAADHHRDGKYRPLRRRQTNYGPDVPPPGQPAPGAPVHAPLPPMPPLTVIQHDQRNAAPRSTGPAANAEPTVEPPVRYKHLPIPAGTPCELCANAEWMLVRDHCHDHGWIRGKLCNRCNSIMGLVDAGKELIAALDRPGLPSLEVYRAYRHRCHECDNADAATPKVAESPHLQNCAQANETADAEPRSLTITASAETLSQLADDSARTVSAGQDRGHEQSNKRSSQDRVGEMSDSSTPCIEQVSSPPVSHPVTETRPDLVTSTNPSRNPSPTRPKINIPSTSSNTYIFDLCDGLTGFSSYGAVIKNEDQIPKMISEQIYGDKPGSNPSSVTSGDFEPVTSNNSCDGQFSQPVTASPPILAPTATSEPLAQMDEGSAVARLGELRIQRTQLNRAIKKTDPADPLHAVYTHTVGQLAGEIKCVEAVIRAHRAAAKRAAAVAEAGGDLLELPAIKLRGQPARSCSTDEAAAAVRATMAARNGRVTADIESNAYPIGHPDYGVRTLQLGDKITGTDWDVTDPVQFAMCTLLLSEATEIEAYSASVEISNLAYIGMIDYRSGWTRARDVVIQSQLHNPVGTESHDDGLKAQSRLHLPDPVSPAADARRAALFKAGGWLTDTKVKGSAGRDDDSGGWVVRERSGWANADPRYRTSIDYAVSDVHDTAALGEVLPMPAPAVYAREVAVQAAVGAVSYLGIALDRTHIEAKIAEHAPQRAAAVARLGEFGILNPSSNDQVAAELLRRGAVVGDGPGQIPLTDKARKPSVKADVLDRLPRTVDLAPVVDALLTYRHHQRVLSTYLRPYYLLCTQGDGRMRSTVYTLQADTGRFSCVHENLQNIPTHGGIRECYVCDPGDLFIDADLSGVEVAVLAALSQDEVLLELVASGRKLHKIIAEQVYGSGYTPRQYGYVKNGVFAKLYGAGVQRIASTVGCSDEEAIEMVRALDDLAPHAKRWGYDLRNRAKAGMQRIQLYSGRVLHLPSATPHKIVNYYVQGTAREILVDGLLRWRQTRWGDYGIIVPVHDEILATVPAAEADEAMTALGQCMASELYGVRIGAEPKWSRPSDRWLSNDHPLAKG